MQPDLAAARPRVRRLLNAADFRAAVRQGVGDVAASSLAALDHGFTVELGGTPVLLTGLRRSVRGVALLRRIHTLHAQVFARNGAVGSATLQAAFRELVLGEAQWHVLHVTADLPALVDEGWRYGTRLGFPCVIAQPAPVRLHDTGEIVEGAPTLTMYAPGVKGSTAWIADSGWLTSTRRVFDERVSRVRARLDRARLTDESGSRFFVLDLDTVPDSANWSADVTFREVSAREAAAQPLRYGTGVWRVEESLHRGDRCFATMLGGELAHHHWVSTDARFLEQMLPPQVRNERTAYPFDAYTYPAFRGQALQAVTHRWLAQRYRKEGLERFAVRISSFNHRSIRGIMKAGYTEVQTSA